MVITLIQTLLFQQDILIHLMPKNQQVTLWWDLDPTFVERVQPGDIIVAKKNFGCGSSREHAPLALKTAGVSCVIAKSFARIFYRNSINIGFAILECPEAVDGIDDGDEVKVDYETGKIYNLTKNTEYQGQPFPPFMQKIIEQGGLVNYVNNKKGQRIWKRILRLLKVMESVLKL